MTWDTLRMLDGLASSAASTPPHPGAGDAEKSIGNRLASLPSQTSLRGKLDLGGREKSKRIIFHLETNDIRCGSFSSLAAILYQSFFRIFILYRPISTRTRHTCIICTRNSPTSAR